MYIWKPSATQVGGRRKRRFRCWQKMKAFVEHENKEENSEKVSDNHCTFIRGRFRSGFSSTLQSGENQERAIPEKPTSLLERKFLDVSLGQVFVQKKRRPDDSGRRNNKLQTKLNYELILNT